MRQVPSVLGPFWVWDTDHLGQVLESGAFWDGQLKPFLDEADPTGWALDFGANVGFFTRYLASRFAHVVAVEAHPGTYGMLVQNLSGVPNVTLINGIAYDLVGAFALMDDAVIGWPIPADLNTCPNASSIAFVPAWNGPYRSVVGDHLVSADARVTLIKIDVQGCDLRALHGLRDTIARCRPLILFEFEGAASLAQGDPWEAYEQFFADRQYTITRVREDLWDYVARPNEKS